ncbi:efflux RND transporter permease subunit [Methylomarinum vadi]|uniref:efflux RND transporter permease subunit n=1 Tax=Methylomarinum vadi TaxID=438855 RepID=UPI00068F4930|nr:efflux RND transporter permease subunit [Methylomarinum vadi]
MFQFVIKNGVIVTVAILIICLFGGLAIFRVPIQMIPDLDVRAISIKTDWPGATPQDVEKEIIIEQEEYLRSIPGLERIISTASTGAAEIEMEFGHGADINEVLIRVNNALSQVPSYPENVDEPRILTTSISSNAFMYFRIQPLPGNPLGIDMEIMHDFVKDQVTPRLERIPGVSQADTWGGSERQIQIYLDPAKLAERHITVEEFKQAVRQRNRDVSGGDLDSGKRRYLLRTTGRFQSLEDIENMVIARRNDTSVHLHDIGHVELDRFETRVKSFANGRPNITVGIRREIGANVIEIMDGVMAEVEELNQTLLRNQGLQMELTSEDVQYVRRAVAVVQQNLLLGALLASAVLYLFLRSFSATLLGASGIPVCTIAAFIGLLLMGRTINVISLAGVAFAIGMTLDNSIVVLENIYRHLHLGKGREQAALEGVREVWPAVLASTLTTVFVFIPIVYITQEAGQLYSDIAIAIAASIIVSMLVAITVIPSACSRYLTSPGVRSGHSAGQRVAASIIAFIDWILHSLTRRLVAIGLILSLTTVIIFALMPKAEYLPEGEEAKTFSFMFAPPGYNLDEVMSVVEPMHDFLLPYLDDRPEQFARGETPVPALQFIVTYARPQSILFIIETKDRNQIDDLIKVLSERYTQIPGMVSFSSRGSIFASNLGGTRSINLDISGPELAPLFATGFKAFMGAKQIFDQPQVRPQPASLTMGQPLLEIEPDWERAAELGFTAEELGYLIWAFSDGAYIDEFFLGDDKIDMFLYSAKGAVKTPEDLNDLALYSPSGNLVTLGSVARIKESVNTETIRRVDGERTVTLSIIPPREIPLEQAVETVKRDLIERMQSSGQIPAGVSLRISGASDLLQATRDALADNFIVAVLISYLLMVAIFRHWGYPLIIMTTVPLGISGGIAGLWLFNWGGGLLENFGVEAVRQPFDMLTMLGFLILIGTVVNNPILLVEQARNNHYELGMQPLAAIIDSVKLRLRPIIMSSVTTILGLSPLVFLPGEGTELYRGIGIIVLFGILFSTLITLVFIPVLLSFIFQFRNLVKSFRRETNNSARTD